MILPTPYESQPSIARSYCSERQRRGPPWGFKLADHRLADLDVGIARGGLADGRALAALLAEDERLAGLAPSMPAAGRSQMAERVAAHADQLDQLAGLAAELETTEALRQAALHTRELAGRIRTGQAGNKQELQPAPTPGPASKSSRRLPFVANIFLSGRPKSSQPPLVHAQRAKDNDKVGQGVQRHESADEEADHGRAIAKPQHPEAAKQVAAPAIASARHEKDGEKAQDSGTDSRQEQPPASTTKPKPPAGVAGSKDTGKSHAEQQRSKGDKGASSGGRHGDSRSNALLLSPTDPAAIGAVPSGTAKVPQKEVDPGRKPRQ